MNKEEKMFRELDGVIKQLKLMRSFEGEELVHDRRVRTALRELEKSRKGGRLQQDRVMRAMGLICEVACEACLSEPRSGRK